MTKHTVFTTLHRAGTFVMPNPWDRGSALVLQELGFPALATTSSGLGRSIGKDDQEVTRDELLAHVAEMTEVLSVPLNVDSERLFPDDPGGIARTVRMLADAGASGCSIEDYDPSTQSIDGVERAAEAVASAAQACAEHSLVLTARAENHLYEMNDLDNTVERLLAYQAAGCDVLYAPGLGSIPEISRVVSEVDRPINVLATPDGAPVSELAKLGVRRISVGGSMYNAAYRSLRIAAEEIRDHGTSEYARR
jgi:2-methylisocitrate lyase-like PEP mutase family enzyme